MTLTAARLVTERARQILAVLRDNFPIREEEYASLIVAKESRDPFRVLVVTILSQSCTDTAAIRAYRRLDGVIGVKPAALARATVSKIRSAIRIAGLHRQKAIALKRLAENVIELYSGKLGKAIKGSLDEVRARLQELPKVGPKTADVLLNIWNFPTISVDTHVNRVSKRLGLAPTSAKYEEVRAYLMRHFNPKDYHDVPLLLMALGRRVCKARNPHCPSCPVESLCPYPYKTPKRALAQN